MPSAMNVVTALFVTKIFTTVTCRDVQRCTFQIIFPLRKDGRLILYMH